MNLERLVLKLRRDGPRRLTLRLADRCYRRLLNHRRRRAWTGRDRTIPPRDLPSGCSPAACAELWPGAADRSWLPDAPARWPAEHAAAAVVAAEAEAGRFDLLGSGWTDVRSADGGLRWHEDFKSGAVFPADCLYLDVPICLPEKGTDIKVPWELSRFQHVFTGLWTRPETSGASFLRQWNHWQSANPVARGVNWACAMDVALRAISWTAALAAWGTTWDRDTQTRVLAALATHGWFIRENLEWIVEARTNHYFSDIVGLAVIAVALRGYRPATAWGHFAARELRREILAQFAPDGFNRECSTSYHRLMLDLATLGYHACRVAHYDLGEVVRQRLLAGYRALDTVCDPCGRAPLIGDNDSGRVFPLVPRADEDMRYALSIGAAVLEAPELAVVPAAPEVALLAGPRALAAYAQRSAPAQPPAGRALPDSGLFTLGRGADHLVIRCGPLTYRPTGSHRHVDQLAIALSIAGRPILVDPGQYCYTPWPQWRNHFLLSAAHNTVTVDGEPQCRFFPLGRMPFTIIDEAEPRCLSWEAGLHHAHFVGRHRGYRRLPGGGDHERQVSYNPHARRWTVRDRLVLTGRHTLTWHFQAHPDVQLSGADRAWRFSAGGHAVWLRWTAGTLCAAAIESGWYAPAYGRKLPAPRLVLQVCGDGPFEATFVLQVEEHS